MDRNKDFTLLDLFCGAGGLTTGFELENFKSLCAVDINKDALVTYAKNFKSANVICDDIRKIAPFDLRLSLGLKKESLSIIIGGPPCQGFSRNVPAGYRYLNDPKNLLYNTYLDFVDEFRPLYVVMENVPEILNAYDGVVRNQIVQSLSAMGYNVSYMSLNAAFYGVPQTRSRAFFIGCLASTIVDTPKQTHYGNVRSLKQADIQLPISNVLKPLVTVSDAISDLPPLNAGDEYTGNKYPNRATSEYQKILRVGSTTLVNHMAKKLSPVQLARAKSLKEGQDARDLPKELAPKKYYSGAYGRLYWNKPSRTITKWVFHPGSGRFFHPTQHRTITIREAARLHSYPDKFHFTGSYTKMAAQIGESVPPLLAKVIASSIKEHYFLHH